MVHAMLREMKPARQWRILPAIILSGLFMAGCDIADQDAPHRLKSRLAETGWTDIQTGTAGWRITIRGIERHSEGISARRETALGQVIIAAGRFRARITWGELLTGSGADVSLTGLGAMWEPDTSGMLRTPLSLPDWPEPTIRALAGAFAGNIPKAAARNIRSLTISGKAGKYSDPTTIQLDWDGSGQKGAISLRRADSSLTLQLKSRPVEDESIEWNVIPDIGKPIGPIRIALDGKISLAGPADLSLVTSLFVPQAVLSLDSGSSIMFTPDGWSLRLEHMEAGHRDGITTQLSGSWEKSKTDHEITLETAKSRSRFKFASSDLALLEVTGELSSLQIPGAATGTLALGELFPVSWQGKPVNLDRFVFRGIAGSTGKHSFRLESPADQLPGIRFRLSCPPGGMSEIQFDLNGIPAAPFVKPLGLPSAVAAAVIRAEIRANDRSSSIRIHVSGIGRPLGDLVPFPAEMRDALVGPEFRSLWQARLDSGLFGLDWQDGRWSRRVHVSTDAYRIEGEYDLVEVSRRDRRGEPVRFMLSGPLLKPKIDFADAGMRAKFLGVIGGGAK